MIHYIFPEMHVVEQKTITSEGRKFWDGLKHKCFIIQSQLFQSLCAEYHELANLRDILYSRRKNGKRDELTWNNLRVRSYNLTNRNSS